MGGLLAVLAGSSLVLTVAGVPTAAAAGTQRAPASRPAGTRAANRTSSLANPRTLPSLRPALLYGNRGPQVAARRGGLTVFGGSETGPIDGLYGPLTESSEQTFGPGLGITAHGAVEPTGWTANGHGRLAKTGQPKPSSAPRTIGGRPVLRVLHMVATAYGPSLQDNYPYGATNYFGQPLTPGTVAVDPSVIPLKTYVWVQGYQDRNLPSGGFLGQALDTGGAIQGDRIDIFMADNARIVSNFGIEPVTVDILGRVQM